MPGRHRAPSRTRQLVSVLPRRTVALGAVAGLGITGALAAVPATAQAATGSELAQLRACESGGNYAINTGNGYYGAYQFNLATWRSVGGSGYPHQASPATQDALAAELQSRRGWAPWPACSRKLGLGSGETAAPAVRTATVTASRSVSRSASSSYAGTVLTTSLVGQDRGDVRALQARLADRGYTVAVDGHYGPQTAGAVTAFQRDAGITVDGQAGPQTWGAAF